MSTAPPPTSVKFVAGSNSTGYWNKGGSCINCNTPVGFYHWAVKVGNSYVQEACSEECANLYLLKGITNV